MCCFGMAMNLKLYHSPVYRLSQHPAAVDNALAQYYGKHSANCHVDCRFWEEAIRTRTIYFSRTGRLIAISLFLCAASSLFATPAAWAWGCKGHQTVAFIAERHLNPDALAAVNQLLKNNPIDPKLARFCQDFMNDLMADAATWADDVRTVRPETGAWHFIDIPRGASESDIARYCPDDGCIIKAIAEQLAILRAPGGDPAAKRPTL